MRVHNLKYLFIICCLGVLCNSVKAQNNQVRLKFNLNEKEVAGKFRIIFYIDGAETEPLVTNGLVTLPNLKAHSKVKIRFIAGRHDLLFPDVRVSEFDKFEGELLFGLKTKPFKAEDIPSWWPPDEKLTTIKYIEFRRNDADVTRLTFYEDEVQFIDMY
jgi:hypothetical protein